MMMRITETRLGQEPTYTSMVSCNTYAHCYYANNTAIDASYQILLFAVRLAVCLWFFVMLLVVSGVLVTALSPVLA